MQVNFTWGLFFGIMLFLPCSDLLGQRKDKKPDAKKKTGKEQARSSVKSGYKKSTATLAEKAQKPQEASWEQGKFSSTLSAESIKPDKTDKKNLLDYGKSLKGEGASRPNETGVAPQKNKTKDQYLDSLLRLSDLIKQQETSAGKAAPPSGNSPARVHSEKTKRQLEDTLDHYFPARKFLLLAQKKEEISPSDFAALLTADKKGAEESKNFPSSEDEAKSSMADHAKEESVKEIGSLRLPEEHLATLKALEARRAGNLPKGIFDSLRRVALRRNAIRIKERKSSKFEQHNKIQEKGRIKHRFFFEGILGGFNQDFSSFQFSPALGFKVFRTCSVGIGPMFGASRQANQWRTSCDLRVFVKKELFKQRCYLQAEDVMHPYRMERGFGLAQKIYAGAGYVLHIGRMTALNVMGLYQIGGAKSQPFVFRVGLSLINKKDK